jgi:hypothetical protein
VGAAGRAGPGWTAAKDLSTSNPIKRQWRTQVMTVALVSGGFVGWRWQDLDRDVRSHDLLGLSEVKAQWKPVLSEWPLLGCSYIPSVTLVSRALEGKERNHNYAIRTKDAMHRFSL